MRLRCLTTVARMLKPAFARALPSPATWRVPSAALAAPASRPVVSARALSGAPGAGSLLDILDSELAYEQQQPVELPAPPAGWELQHKPGDTRLLLAKRASNERITVELSVDEQGLDDDDDDGTYAPLASGGGDDEDGDDDDDEGVTFSVTLAKDGAPHKLVAECRSDGTYLQILHAALEPSSPADVDDEDDEFAYSGPVFDELDEGLQAELEAYLSARGVDAALGGVLKIMAAAKEQSEYVKWLVNLKAFVAA